ncbi:hypothetical protein DOY81_005451 [Sarcophaga bullata]|nr:hypothetical protein DOY81_005451 [Sarcophaga bullata]
MPSVGSTPTTTSPAPQQQQQSLTQSMAPQHFHLPPTQQHSSALGNVQQQQQHAKIQQQYSLPLQLQYQVTTTQPSPAGMFLSQAAGIISSTAALGNTSSFFNAASSGADLSPTSSTASFSSVDTNQTLLNTIVASQQQKQQQLQTQSQAIAYQHQHQQAGTHSSKTKYSSQSSTSKASTSSSTNNRSYRTKYSQFMIITPAVSIDRDFDRDTRSDNATTLTAADNHGFHSTEDDPYFPQNGNVFRSTALQSSIDSGNSSDSGNSFRSNYNPYIHTSRQHLIPKTASPFYNFSPSSWRWCTLICAAMRCFGAGGSGGGGGASGRHTTYSSSFGRPPYQRSRSSGPHTSSSKTPHRRLRSYSTSSFTPETAFEHFSAPFKARKTRDEQNNIAYEL